MSLTLDSSGNSLRPGRLPGWAGSRSPAPADSPASAISAAPPAPIASHRATLTKNKRSASVVRRAGSSFPALCGRGTDCLTPLDLKEDGADRSSSYNHRNRNSLHLSSARSEEFEDEFSQEFGWLGTAMKNQQRGRRERLSIFNQSPAVDKARTRGDGSPDGSSIFKDSEERGSGSENNMEEVFNENIPEVQVQRITDKMKPVEEIYRVTTDYDTYAVCEQALLRGIEVIKHNYSNDESKRVKLRLSRDKKSLCYADTDEGRSLFSRLRGERVVKFSSMRGFLFGAVSSTFAKKRKRVVEAMGFQRSLILQEKSSAARAQLPPKSIGSLGRSG